MEESKKACTTNEQVVIELRNMLSASVRECQENEERIHTMRNELDQKIITLNKTRKLLEETELKFKASNHDHMS